MKGFGVREGCCERGYVLAENMYRTLLVSRLALLKHRSRGALE
jgi:hypothetical protein